jgi:hypothetical protein
MFRPKSRLLIESEARMLTRTLATLTLLLALTGGTDPIPSTAGQLDRARAARRARIADDLEGCREPAPSPIPVAPAACADEGQP